MALPSTVGYLLADQPTSTVGGYTLGQVSLVALLILVPMTVLAAPWGVRLAHRLSQRGLGVAFGLFLLLAGARMLQRALG